MKKDYCKYEGNDYCLVYRYTDITEKNNTYEHLFNKLKNDLIRAKDIINNLR